MSHHTRRSLGVHAVSRFFEGRLSQIRMLLIKTSQVSQARGDADSQLPDGVMSMLFILQGKLA